MSELRDLTLEDTLEVVKGMRQWDRRCMVAQLGQISDEEFAVNRWQSPGPAWVIYQDGKPAALAGISLPNAWAGTLWFLATDEMKSWGKLLRETRRVIGNITNPRHAEYRHRLEAHTIEGWLGAESLVEHLGFRNEGFRARVGWGGEGFKVWAITGPTKEIE
jgi:hypothetical protein